MNDYGRPAKNARANIAQEDVSSGDNDLAVISWMRLAARNGDARTIREAAGISASELARELRVAPSSLSRWERGVRRPRGEMSVRWARILQRLAAA